jgi:hypothetical protein
MRYVATTNTCLPNGKTVLKGEEYDWPPSPAEDPDTFSEMAQRAVDNNEDAILHLRGEPPVRRGPGRPKKEDTQ